MLVHDDRYRDAVQEMLGKAGRADLAVAFWGRGAETYFKGWRGRSLRIICNLALGGTNPDVIPKLMALPGAEVRQLDSLHAKLILTENAMVLGSANMSANGLGFEAGESATFREVGIRATNIELLGQARAWFEQVWKAARKVEDDDLRRARVSWKKRRSARAMGVAQRSGPSSLLDLEPEVLKDREIYFAVFRSGLSDAAKKCLKEENRNIEASHSKLDLYEGWDEDDLPKTPDAVIIPIYWGARGKIEIGLPQRPIPDLEGSYIAKGDDGDYEEWRLDFTAIVRERDIDGLGLPFQISAAQRKVLVASVRDWLKFVAELDEFKERDAICLPVYDFLRWLTGKGRR